MVLKAWIFKLCKGTLDKIHESGTESSSTDQNRKKVKKIQVNFNSLWSTEEKNNYKFIIYANNINSKSKNPRGIMNWKKTQYT